MDELLFEYLQEQDVDGHMGFRILLVDDEEDNLFLLKTFLEVDYEVYTATSGEEGLDFIQKQEVDLMIVDQRMSGMDGLTFCGQSAKIAPHTMRVMLTAYSDREMLLAAMASGKIFRVMTKPWNIIEIRATVEEAFKRQAYKRAFGALIDELQHKNEELRNSYTQLKKVQEEKLQAERLATMGQVTARFIHEMNNQLTVLVLLKSMRETLRAQSSIGDSIDFIIEAIENLYEMVQLLQQFTKGGEPELQKSYTDMSELLRQAVRFIRQSPIAEGVEFTETYAEVDFCWVDRQRLKQVILNLLRNAIQALTEKKQIWVELHPTSDKTITFSIRDCGRGVPKDLQEKIFEPFFTTKSQQGLGLGLEVCKQIVEKHKGKITLESQTGEGTTFTIQLPSKKE